MSTTAQLRDRRQITLPAEIVAAAGLSTNDRLEISWVNGAIVMVPTRGAPAASVARFLGATKGLYGDTVEAADAYVREQRNAW